MNLTRQDNLKIHKKTHEEKNFECTYCNNKFSSKFNVERHVKLNHTLVISGQGKIITEEKVKASCDVKCQYCSKSYTSEQGLRKHIEKYHKISTDTLNGNFISHGDKMFGMFENSSSVDIQDFQMDDSDVCNDTENGNNEEEINLNTAEKEVVHEESQDKTTVEKNPKCDLCNKIFSTKKTLRKHMKIHTKTKSGKEGVRGPYKKK